MGVRGSESTGSGICGWSLAFHFGLIFGFLFGCGGEVGPTHDDATEIPHAGAETLDDRPVILFLGDSLTAGYGLNPEQAYPALIQEKIDRSELSYRVVNAGVSGDTTAGGLGRIDWLLRQQVDCLVLALGGNDGLRGIDVGTTESNLQGIIDRVKEINIDAKILVAGMQAPPSMGGLFTGKFRRIFPSVAERNDLPLVPFLLDGVGGDPDLNQPDGIHPTAAGQEIVAETVWEHLEPLLSD